MATTTSLQRAIAVLPSSTTSSVVTAARVDAAIAPMGTIKQPIH